MELVLPNNYVEVEEEEMMYLDGGWVYRGAVAGLIDWGIMLTPAGALCAPIKYMGRSAAKQLIRRYASTLSSGIRWVAQSLLGLSFNLSTGRMLSIIMGNAFCLTSIGGVCGLILDAADGRVNGRIGG